jgi:hypothetical protein
MKQSKRDEKWLENYVLLKSYIAECGHLPNKRKVENRGLLNWWKYNQRMRKKEKLHPERQRLLSELDSMRKSGRKLDVRICDE